MINILCVCGNGMGTSTLLKIALRTICDEEKINANVESAAFSEALSYYATIDLIITNPEWASMISPPDRVIVSTAMNLIDKKCVREVLLSAVNEHFSHEIGK